MQYSLVDAQRARRERGGMLDLNQLPASKWRPGGQRIPAGMRKTGQARKRSPEGRAHVVSAGGPAHPGPEARRKLDARADQQNALLEIAQPKSLCDDLHSRRLIEPSAQLTKRLPGLVKIGHRLAEIPHRPGELRISQVNRGAEIAAAVIFPKAESAHRITSAQSSTRGRSEER